MTDNDKIYFNDSLLDADAACVSPFDAGLLYAMGLFETVRVYAGEPFRLTEHLDRMLTSAEQLDLKLRHTSDQIFDAVYAVIRANQLHDARLRITVTAGPVQPDAEQPGPGPTLLITATSQVGYPPEFYDKGMAVATAAARVNPADLTVRHKTLNYWPRLLTLQAARNQHCGEAIWFTIDNRLAEGCVSNVFLIADGPVALTPTLDTPVLPGVTRATVLELCRANGIPTEEKTLTAEDINAANEMFLTNAIMEVMPVVLIDRKPLADGKVGQVTRDIARLYRELVEKETGQ